MFRSEQERPRVLSIPRGRIEVGHVEALMVLGPRNPDATPEEITIAVRKMITAVPVP